MSNVFLREQIGAGAYFGSLRQPQFKTNLLAVNLLFPIDPEHLPANALVPMLLEKCCEKYNSYKALSKKLDKMYGAYAGAYLSKLGDNLSVSLSISLIGDRYALNGEELLKDGAELLLEILFAPLYDENGLLNEENFLLQKQALIDGIQAEQNEKRRYALNRAMDLMFEGDPYGMRRYGTLAQAEAVTAKDVTEAYHRILDTAHVEAIHVGQGDPSGAKAVLEEAFSKAERHPRELPPTKASPLKETAAEKTEYFDVSQSKLCIGFKTGEGLGSSLVNATRVMIAILGGSPTSKLFVNVRETMQLCYYCSAHFERSKGALIIDSGVDKDNIEKAKEAIIDQVRQLQQGDFTDEEMDFAKLSLQNSFRSAEESDFGLQRYFLSALAMGGKLCMPSEQIGGIMSVTREDVMKAAQLLNLDTVYLLTSLEGGDENE